MDIDVRHTLERHVLSADLPILGLQPVHATRRYDADPQGPPQIVLESVGETQPDAAKPWIRLVVRQDDRQTTAIGSGYTKETVYGAVVIDIFEARLPGYTGHGVTLSLARQLIAHYEKRRLLVQPAPPAYFVRPVARVFVESPGSGYTEAPVARLVPSPSGGEVSRGRLGPVVVSGGSIFSIPIISGGAYSREPSVAFDGGGGGIGAAATALLSASVHVGQVYVLLLAGTAQHIPASPDRSPHLRMQARIPFQFEETSTWGES